VVTHQLQVERRTTKVRRPKTDVVPLDHATKLWVYMHETGESRYIRSSVWLHSAQMDYVGLTILNENSPAVAGRQPSNDDDDDDERSPP